jgi:hypothetical protein
MWHNSENGGGLFETLVTTCKSIGRHDQKIIIDIFTCENLESMVMLVLTKPV